MDHITLGQPYKRIIDKSGQTTLKVSLYKDGQAGLFDIDDAEVVSLTSNKALVTIPKWYFDTTGFLGIFYKDESDNVIEVVNATVVNESIAPIKLPETCIIKGSLSDLMGNGPKDTEITFHVVHIPTRKNSSIITGKPFTTVPDINGNFTIALVKGTTVMCTIPSAGIKNQFKVPEQDTANLIDLLPEISQ